MSMSVEERRTQIVERQDFPAGSVRLVKASSRYDRRRRYYAVEFLAAGLRGQDEDYHWTVIKDWPVIEGGENADAFYTAAWLTVRAMEAAARARYSPGLCDVCGHRVWQDADKPSPDPVRHFHCNQETP